MPRPAPSSELIVPLVGARRQLFLSCYSKDCEDVFLAQRLICCSKCRQCFHSTCINPALVYEIVIRYPWHCNKCKICVSCLDTTNESTMIICDACDRGFHLGCTNQLIDEIPQGNWYCNDCQVCKQCDKLLADEEATANLYSDEGNKLCRPCMDSRRLNAIRFRNERCWVCCKRLDLGGLAENERVICVKCSQASHAKCSHPLPGRPGRPAPPDRLCAVCLRLESAQLSLD